MNLTMTQQLCETINAYSHVVHLHIEHGRLCLEFEHPHAW